MDLLSWTRRAADCPKLNLDCARDQGSLAARFFLVRDAQPWHLRVFCNRMSISGSWGREFQVREKSSNEFRFGGHQTFALRIAWLPKAAAAIEAGEDPLSNPLDGVVSLGLGKNMVEALRCWIEAFNIAQKLNHHWTLTSLGRAIFGPLGHDQFLEDEQTLWLLHWKIATLRKAPFFAWELLINRWNEPTFSVSAILEAFAEEAERVGRPLSPVSARQHFDVWLHTYVPSRSGRGEDSLDSPLSALRLIYPAGERQLPNGRRETVYAFDLERKATVRQALFEYCIHDWWDAEFEHEETVTLREVTFGRASPGRVFRMSELEVRDRLDALSRSRDGSVELSESVNQFVVRRRRKIDSLDLLARVYEMTAQTLETLDA